MPRKGPNAQRPTQGFAARLAHEKPQPARASTKQIALSQKQEQETDDIEDAAEENSEEDSVMEMLAMLQEIQKHKASKSAALSVAFQKKKVAMFAEARKTAETAIRDGFAAIEKARTTINELRTQEHSQIVTLSTLRGSMDAQAEYVQKLLDQCTGVVEDLSHRRAAQINDASIMLETQTAAREKSRSRIYTMTKERMAENVENQKVATDATALIKCYQTLFLA